MNIKSMIYAFEKHGSVNHLYDGHPYSVHLTMVYSVALRHISLIPTYDRDNVLDACLLHDCIEDCRVTYNDLSEEFGYIVADMVYAVTNDKGKTRKERAGDSYYRGIRDIPYAVFIKLCDRIANVEYSMNNKTGSSMYGKYFKENSDFIDGLFKGDSILMLHYNNMINELNGLF